MSFKEIAASPGYQSLKAEAIQSAAREREKFNVNGGPGRCSNGFRWAIGRARHYSHYLGIPVQDILNKWEEERDYWYLNYYQDCNFPKLNDVRVFSTIDAMRKSVGTQFRCPRCGGVSTDPYECNSGLPIGVDMPCNSKSYGLFRTLGKGVNIFIVETMQRAHIFMPVAWEQSAGKAVASDGTQTKGVSQALDGGRQVTLPGKDTSI